MSYIKESCEASTLYSIDARCEQSIGGIKRILIIARDNIDKVTVDENGQITAITTVASAKFEQWKFRRNTGSYTSTVTSDVSIGNSFATTEVNLQFSKAEAQKRLAIQNAINAGSVVIVEAVNGESIYLGYDNEVVITSAVMQSGTANTDLNGFTLTLQDVSAELPRFLSGVDLNSLTA